MEAQYEKAVPERKTWQLQSTAAEGAQAEGCRGGAHSPLGLSFSDFSGAAT